jgi:hypothetical protein
MTSAYNLDRGRDFPDEPNMAKVRDRPGFKSLECQFQGLKV